jgi:hypothetical protein
MRFNDFSTISIARGTDNAENTSNVLTATMSIDFQILEEAKLSVNNVGNATFAESVLDEKIISDIRERRSAPEIKLIIDQKGKANPFAL